MLTLATGHGDHIAGICRRPLGGHSMRILRVEFSRADSDQRFLLASVPRVG